MILAALSLLAGSASETLPSNDHIVFAAERYADHFGNVYQNGPSHLFSIQRVFIKDMVLPIKPLRDGAIFTSVNAPTLSPQQKKY